jgi:NAD(P)-dependent dehydrogenase (short-subunit alcohol dehydrogenase family)
MPAEQAATHEPAKPRARVPLGRVLNPSEIAGLAVYLGSAESSGMTGQSIHVDGGMVLS